MATRRHLEDRLLLRRIERQALVGGPRHEGVEYRLLQEVGGDVVEVGEEFGQLHPTEPSRPAATVRPC